MRLLLSLLPFCLATSVRAGDGPDFNRDVKPILAKNCFACHGPDDGHREAGLRLDTREGAVAARKRGPAIVPGKSSQSILLKRITNHDEPMPPAESGAMLTPAQVAILTKWIDAGAVYAPHWSFVKPKKAMEPELGPGPRRTNPIDIWIGKELDRVGLKHSPEADRHILVRRLSLDLRGLPPTPAEVKAFVEDKSADAYPKLVEKFLADPAYGERMARPWLDLARYADSAGYGSDPLRPNMWKYREWVIDAFNKNKLFDQFTIEQLAGDLLPNATAEQKAATAFHRNTMTNTEGGTDDEEFRVAAVKDRTDVTMQAWMGLTVGCAKCHTHKYDPITQKEYYQLYAVFNQTADSDKPDEKPLLDMPDADYRKRLADHAAKRRKLLLAVTAMLPFRNTVEELKQHKAAKPAMPTLPVMEELDAKKRRKTKLMVKGDFQNLGDEVQPGLPAAFHPSAAKKLDRLELAKWILHPDNPLTARVAVNRLWAQFFGRGLVETEEDFGTQGELPTHPVLLDWLAVDFIEQKWDVKAMIRRIVLSQTYRQSSKVSEEASRKDPRNIYLSHAPRFRLEAEMVRDQALALSGLLSRKVGGPSVFPPQPEGLWQAAFNGQRTYPTSTGDDRYRRGLYTFWRRTVPPPGMAAFDAPSRETCTIRRIRTNTPLQAFVTLNDPIYVEAAQALARRILAEGSKDDASRIVYALELATCRPATDGQKKTLLELLNAEKARYAKDSDAGRKLAGEYRKDVDAMERAAWTVVASVLLNLDAVLTRN